MGVLQARTDLVLVDILSVFRGKSSTTVLNWEQNGKALLEGTDLLLKIKAIHRKGNLASQRVLCPT